MLFTEKVPSNFCENIRLDKYIASLPNGMNRSKLKSCAYQILINGKEEKLSTKVKAGDVINIAWEDNIPCDIEPENIPLDIIYEDKNTIVINKAQGIVTHPALGNWSGTLVNALLYYLDKDAICNIQDKKISENIESLRPFIVHRLDKDTSGVIVTAKNRSAEEWLSEQFAKRYVQKEYYAIVCGKPPALAGDIKTQIIRDPKDRKRFKAVTQTQEGKYARTIYHHVASYGKYSIMHLRLKTGRTHQIRVHMKYIGCSIMGDVIYGKVDKEFPFSTLMLHARKIKLFLPNEKRLSTFYAPIPERFYEVLKILKKKYKCEIMKWGKNHEKKYRSNSCSD